MNKYRYELLGSDGDWAIVPKMDADKYCRDGDLSRATKILSRTSGFLITGFQDNVRVTRMV